MKHLFKSFRKKLVVLGFATFFTAIPAVAGTPGGEPNTVNVNIESQQVDVTEVNEIFNDVILESLWEIVGQVERRNVWDTSQPSQFWDVELTVSDAEFATALADVKTQLYDLAYVPGRNTTYSILQDEQTGERLDQVSQTYEETQTGQDTVSETSFSTDAVEGVDYIALGDPDDYNSWIAISGPVNVEVDIVTTTTTFIDALTTTEYNSVAVWSVSALRTISPLLLDMDGDGAIQASGGQWLPHQQPHRDRMRFFDFHGDKFPVLMEWPGPNDGILCEPSADGSISGANLFGNATGFKDGYEALRVKDANNDGKVNGAELKGLMVWTDLNSDARPQKGEVKSLADHNITELSVKHKNFVASFVKNGETERMYDWWPQTYELNRIRVTPKKV